MGKYISKQGMQLQTGEFKQGKQGIQAVIQQLSTEIDM